MGDNSTNQADSSDEEIIIEEYETIYLPSNVLAEYQEREEMEAWKAEDNVETNDGKVEETKLNHKKPQEASNIRTIKRIDEETENVVILIRPRRQSGSPAREENPSCKYSSIDFVDQECKELRKEETAYNLLQEGYISEKMNGNSFENDQSEFQMSANVCQEATTDLHSSAELKGTPEYEKLSNDLLTSDIINGNQVNNSTSEQNIDSDDQDITTDQNLNQQFNNYEIYGARPKTFSQIKHDIPTHHGSNQIYKKPTSRHGISAEANTKLKQLKDTGQYDNMVKTCSISRNKGVVHDIVQNPDRVINEPDMTEDDDVLIWKLMKSLRERSAKSESDEGINHDKIVSNSPPKDKCDWSHEKATLTKDKYLSRRLQTKESGQVKVITFMSPSKENKDISIVPLKTSKTLPFNVKNIFQQKMDELKNKNRVCLTGGKELMFSTINVENPYFKGLDLDNFP